MREAVKASSRQVVSIAAGALHACLGQQPGIRFDEHLLRVRKFRDLGFCGRIAAQMIGDDFARHRVRAQHTLEKQFLDVAQAQLKAEYQCTAQLMPPAGKRCL